MPANKSCRTVDNLPEITQFAPLVKKIAYHMMARLPANVQVEDLIQAGMMGLLEASRNFDAGQGAEFETYASQRIRGAMLDELREIDWLPRQTRKNQRRIDSTLRALEQELSRAPSEQEIADALGVVLAEYQQMLFESKGQQLLFYEDFQQGADDDDFLERHAADNRPGPLDVLRDRRFHSHLVEAITVLPEREKLVMGLYYEQELNLREIGEVLGVTESRVCQLHSQAIGRLRANLKDWI